MKDKNEWCVCPDNIQESMPDGECNYCDKKIKPADKVKNFVDTIAPLILHQCWCSFQLGAGQSFNLTPTEEQLKSLKDAIVTFLRNPNITPEQMHENWVRFKLANGWIYGLAKDESQKMHPNLIPWKDLSDIEKKKDVMHLASQIFLLEIAKLAPDKKDDVEK